MAEKKKPYPLPVQGGKAKARKGTPDQNLQRIVKAARKAT